MPVRRPQLSDGTQASDQFRCAEVWDPTKAELTSIGSDFGLHDLAVEDALEAQQRPKVERFGPSSLLALKSIHYDDASESLDFADLLLMFSDDYVVVVGHHPAPRPDLDRPRAAGLTTDLGPGVVVHRVVDAIVDSYEPVMDALEVDIRQIEVTVFGPSDDQPTERIYKLKRQVVELLRNIRPLREPLGALRTGDLPGIDDELTDYFRDVEDHLHRVVLRAENAGELLTEILDANLTQVSLRQNEDMRKMSAWAAIFLVPTLLAGVWGMNFANMPELNWRYGYPMALVAMISASLGLYWRFRRIDWL